MRAARTPPSRPDDEQIDVCAQACWSDSELAAELCPTTANPVRARENGGLRQADEQSVLDDAGNAGEPVGERGRGSAIRSSAHRESNDRYP